jgi:hypothetical protein
MIETISTEDYESEVLRQANHLSQAATQAVEDGEYDTHHDAVLELASDVLDAHEWFTQRQYGPAAHGCIIEHATEYDTQIARYQDWWSMAESNSIETTVERVAYLAFESAVIEAANDLAGDEE